MNKTDGLPSAELEVGSKVANIAGFVLISKIITFTLSGVALILVTRLLGPTQYGIYTLAVTFAGIFGSIGYFSYGFAVNKFVAQYKQVKNKEEISHIISNSLFLVLVTGGALTILCSLFSGLISQYIFHTSTMSYVIVVVSLWIITSMIAGVVYESLLGFGDGKHVAVIVGVQSFFQASISIGLALLGFGALAPILGLVIGYFLEGIVGLWIILRYNGLSLKAPSFSYIWKLLEFSVPLVLSLVFSSIIGSFGLLFLGYHVLPSIIGNIGIASKTGTLIGVLFDSISLAILPTLSAAFVNKKLKKGMGRIYGYIVYFAVALVSPLLFYMIIFSTPFTYSLFGSGFSYAPLYVSILGVGLLLGVAGSYASTLLISDGKVRLVLKYNLIAYFLILLLYLILIPLFGAIGYVLVAFLAGPLLVDLAFHNQDKQDVRGEMEAQKII